MQDKEQVMEQVNDNGESEIVSECRVWHLTKKSEWNKYRKSSSERNRWEGTLSYLSSDFSLSEAVVVAAGWLSPLSADAPGVDHEAAAALQIKNTP